VGLLGARTEIPAKERSTYAQGNSASYVCLPHDSLCYLRGVPDANTKTRAGIEQTRLPCRQWISDGDMKPSPMGPGGKMSSDDQVHWMDGKFFLVMHSKFKGAMGDGMALAIMGYDPEKKVYTYNEYNSMGQINHSEGTITGDTWNWTSDENMGGQTFKGRYTMKVVSPTVYTFTYEMSQDGTNWTKVMEGKSMKQ
jgi:hypothetical protein